MLYKKITNGYVVQTFDDKGELLKQEFVASDVEYELETGEPVDSTDMPLKGNEYAPFDMVQPIL